MSPRSGSTSIVQFYPMAVGQPSGFIVQQLNQEWEEYAHLSPTWPTTTPTFRMVLQSVRFNPDLVLGELIEACQAGDALAGRVIVQALLPKVILMSTSNPYPPVEHILSALWIRIARYRLDKRPRSIAANLVLDARKDAVAECQVRVTVPPHHDGTDDIQVVAEIIDTAIHLGLATPQSLSIVKKVYMDGMPSSQVAQFYHMTPDAVRRRCCDTIRRLRDNRHYFADLVSA